MIDPTSREDRLQLARAMEQAQSQLLRFHRSRRQTIKAYLGIPDEEAKKWALDGKWPFDKLPKGNLLQLSAISIQLALAYGKPQASFTARNPSHKALATQLEAAVNRYAQLLNLDEIARAMAADSFFGYGIAKAGIGRLPESVRKATGLTIGPCIWRVPQERFIYDITAMSWADIKYAGDDYFQALDEAREQYPDFADQINDMTTSSRLDTAKVFPRQDQIYNPERVCRLVDVHLPGSSTVCTWTLDNDTYQSIARSPLAIRDYDGHWSGVYEVETHLYTPDELVPVSHAESIKSLHFLFNTMMDTLAKQAVSAKYNPLYKAAGDKDMKRLWAADDRVPVSVVDPNNFGAWEIPGPTQSQAGFAATVLNLYKQMDFNLDDRLGLAPTAGTATQSNLIRGATNTLVAEARRRHLQCLQHLFQKLAHLLLTDNTLWLPLFNPVGHGSDIMNDVSWYPSSLQPRTATIDDFDVQVDPFSIEFQEPGERLGTTFTALQQILLVMQAEAQGMPVDSRKFIELVAKRTGQDELNDLFLPPDPRRQHEEQQGELNIPRIGAGHYIRENVSTRSNNGALMQALTNTQGGGVDSPTSDNVGA